MCEDRSVQTAHPSPRLPLLQRAGSKCARHPFVVLAAWALALAGVTVGSQAAGGTYSDNVNLSGTESHTGLALLRAHDPDAGGYSGLVVIASDHGPLSAQAIPVGEAVTNLSKLKDVISVTDPLATTPPTVSSGGEIAYINVHLSVLPKTLGKSYEGHLRAADRPLTRAGLDVQYGGQFDALFQPKANDAASELIGFAVALIVLLIGFGSVAAAVLPLVTALLAMLVGLNIVGVISAAISFGTASPTLATMIGLGVGIDYAVFLTTRHRQSVIDGRGPIESAALAASTSGRAVLVAASTVSVALLGLFASGINFLGFLGLAAVFGVVSAALGATTLVPAALGLLGRHVDALRVKKAPVAEAGRDGDWWHNYASSVGKRPWLYLAGGVVLLAVIAIPLLSVRLGTVDAGASPSTYTSKQAYDLVARGFGPGANGPFTVVVDLRAGTSAASAKSLATTVQAALARTSGVARVSGLSPTQDGALLVGTVVAGTGPQDPATTSVFTQIDRSVLPAALKGSGATGYVSGSTASNIQFAAKLTNSLPVVIAVVVACAFLLIMTAFRSLWLAVKAALCNLISISAAYGVIVAVYQWGWGRSLFGVSENVPIESYVPVFMFAIVFGLSMDYEIFLLSRVKEQWDRTGNHHLAVARGLSATGRVITCAALIMASVFFAFVASSSVVVKQLAVGLSASVLLDATVVRLLLVPAVMYLLGTRSWWLPAWLDRLLPHIEVGPRPVTLSPAPVSQAGAPAPMLGMDIDY
jgi:putative drug exporter of the RND superfamily